MASRQFIEFPANDCRPLGSHQTTAGMEQIPSNIDHQEGQYIGDFGPPLL
jgi:hypothetical protein